MHKVLIADDNEVARLRLKRMKIWGQASGFMIAGEANDGAEAVRILETEHYDLVLSDIRMPKMDGVELLAAIRGQQRATFVVLVSEFADFDAARQGLVHGASDYLVKPVDEAALLAVLKRLGKKLEVKKAGYVSQRDIEQFKQCLCEGNGKNCNAATDISRQVWNDAEGDPDRAVAQMSFVLREVVAYLAIQNPLMDKFVNLDQLIDPPEETISNLHDFNAYVTVSADKILTRTRMLRHNAAFGPTINAVNQYALSNIDRNLTHRDIASAVFINPNYLSQLFKEKTGMTVGAFLADLKIERAKRLLAQRTMKVYEVSSMLGYSDVEYFSRVFKQKVGRTPKEYQESSVAASL